jgi:hypothetical protein
MSFNDAYLGTPPWDIGRPQGAFRALADAGVAGTPARLGCGTGEHALMVASVGLEATGIDDSPIAIEKAQTKARESGLDVRFVVGSVLELAALDERWDRARLRGVPRVRRRRSHGVRPELGGRDGSGGRYFMLCFSDRQPGGSARAVSRRPRSAPRSPTAGVSSRSSRRSRRRSKTDASAWLSAISRM